jgi:hypothetical protein
MEGVLRSICETMRRDRVLLGLVIVLAPALPHCVAPKARSGGERAAEKDPPEDEDEQLPLCTAQPGAAPGPEAASPPPAASAQTESESGSDVRSAKEVFAGLEIPHLLCRPVVRFSQEALAHHVRGVALVRCILELDGWLSHCRVVKSLPYMDDPILASMMTWRLPPVRYQGHPQRVEMIFPVRVGPAPP